jgi:hypothetical protein
MLMRLLRGVIATLLAMNAALAAMPALMTAFYKLGVLHPRQDQMRMVPLMDTVSWLMLAALGAAVVLSVASALMLILRRRGASDMLWGALVAEFLVFVLVQGPAYEQAFKPEARMVTMGLFVALLLSGVLLSLMEPPKSLGGGDVAEPPIDGDLAAGPR